MAEVIQEDKEPIQKITMNFMNREDVKEFSRIIKQSITPKTNSLRFPKCNIKKLNNYSYKDES